MTAGDTIFALSSGAPPAAIAIIRISGPAAITAVEALAGRVPEPRKPSLAKLYDPQGTGLLDEALLLTFPGPDSATGEDLAELHLHGGRGVIRAVEAALARLDGLRKAEAGEFTRRAFQNGRLDLNEADALGDLLAAESEWQRRAAAGMLGGNFGAKIEEWREEILRLSALVEADLDFSDEDDVDGMNSASLSAKAHYIICDINMLMDIPAAEKLRDGLKVTIGGPPNSGKSTLLNALVDRDAAIVSDIAGTTRDIIEIPVVFEGIPFIFIDTAGIRGSSKDEIEMIGIERAERAFAESDIILWLGPQGNGPGHPCLIEVDPKVDEADGNRKSGNAVRISAKENSGIGELIQRIVASAKDLLPPPDSLAINARQRAELVKVTDALQGASARDDLLIAAEQLRQARLALDALTGRAHTEDMLDTLFGRFCIGK